MALPLELREQLLKYLPCSLFERSAALLRTYLNASYRDVDELMEVFDSPYLSSTLELLQKIAAWVGAAGYTSQMYLPRGLGVALAAQRGDMSVFRDACLRWGHGHALTLRILLRQLSKPDRNQWSNLYMLLILLVSYEKAGRDPDEVSEDEDFLLGPVIDDIQLGYIVLLPRVIKLILQAVALYDIDLGQPLLSFFSGAGVAFNLGIPLSPRLPKRHLDFAYGYACAGGQNWKWFIETYASKANPITLREAKNDATVRLNLPTRHRPDDLEQISLGYVAYEAIENYLPGKPQFRLYDLPDEQLTEEQRRMNRAMEEPEIRRFPEYTQVSLRTGKILQQRARGMLPLIAQIYEPSPSRDHYIQQLEFLINPTGDFPPSSIESQLALIFSRFDLVSDEDLTIAIENSGFLLYLDDPLLFMKRSKVWQAEVVKIVVELAVLDGKQFEMAGMLMPEMIEELGSRPNDHYPRVLIDTLEYFRCGLPVSDASNSYCVSLLNATLVNSEVVEDKVLLTFQVGERLLSFLTNQYERNALRKLGFVINFTEPIDPVIERIATLSRDM